MNIHVTLWNRRTEEVRTSEDLERLIEDACDSTFQKFGTKTTKQILVENKRSSAEKKMYRNTKENNETVRDLMGEQVMAKKN